MAAGPAAPSIRPQPRERPIAKGLATPALLAHVLVSKYCDHLPLYRQSQIFARQGVEIDRSTLANWVGGACWWLERLQARLAEHIFASQKLFADDTPIPVLDPGRGRTKTGRLWVYARDDRLCVPKTLSVLMTPRNHLSWRNDRAPVFRRGGLGLTIQVEDPA
jgi:hypothetical protein